jgi:hypothetical protein
LQADSPLAVTTKKQEKKRYTKAPPFTQSTHHSTLHSNTPDEPFCPRPAAPSAAASWEASTGDEAVPHADMLANNSLHSSAIQDNTH